LQTIERINFNQKILNKLNSQLKQKKIYVDPIPSPRKTCFTIGHIETGDFLVIDPTAFFSAEVSYRERNNIISSKNLCIVPYICYHSREEKISYGLLEKKDLALLSKGSLEEECSTETLLEEIPDKDNTLIYVILPKDRLEAGKIFIKHKGKWWKDKKEPLPLSLLGLCRTRDFFDVSLRFLPENDTPQGLYIIHGLRYFPEETIRPDIALKIRPLLLDFPENNHSSLNRSIPEKWRKTSWFNEAVLAAVFGRSLLRIHGSPPHRCIEEGDEYITPFSKLRFCRTSGCLNIGSQMLDFIKILVDLQILSPTIEQQLKNKQKFDILLKGVYLIVKDETTASPSPPLPPIDTLFSLEPIDSIPLET
jgi:hypothetical protein